MPTYTDATEATYALLPGHHRLRDDDDSHPLDQPLKRYLSGVGDQLQTIVDLLDRVAYDDDGAASELADPALADAAWLPWLAQLVGANVTGRSVPEMRELIAGGAGSDGSTAALIATAKGALTGTKTVTFSRHYGPTLDPADVGWGLGVATRHDETPDVAELEAAVASQTPAGAVVEHRWGVGTWDELEARYATWTAWEAGAATWDEFEDGT